MATAVRENSELTFTIIDIRARKPMLVYFQSKILKTRVCRFEFPHSQLIQVYFSIEIYLKRDLYKPSDSITIS